MLGYIRDRKVAGTFLIPISILFMGCYWSAQPPDIFDITYVKKDFENKKILFVPISKVNFASIGAQEKIELFNKTVSASNDTTYQNHLSNLFFDAIKKTINRKSIFFGGHLNTNDLVKIGNFTKAFYIKEGIRYRPDYLTSWNGLIDTLELKNKKLPIGCEWTKIPIIFYRPTDSYLIKNGNPEFVIVVNDISFSTKSVNGGSCSKKQLLMSGVTTVWDCNKRRPVILDEFTSGFKIKCEFSLKDLLSYVKDASFKSFYKTPLIN